MKKVGRKVVSVLLTLCMLLTMLPVSALAADEGTVDTAPAETNLAEPVNTGNSSSDEGETPVSTLVAGTENSVDYVDEDGQTQTCTEYTTVVADTTTWSNGWYVVTGTVTLDDRVEVSDSVNLILADGAELNATKGIGVTAGNSLTIYGQSGGTGKLTAEAYQVYDSAAIGGTDDKDQNRDLCAHGDITINGGDITATGASAGIGGGESATGTSGTITINGGTVKATGGSDAAGIGGGYANTTNGGAIIINGGTVTATGGSKAAGIGAGYSGAGGMEITITGGTVTATGGSNDTYGGAGIGANYGGSTNPVSITITGSADVTATGGLGAAGIGGGSGKAEAAVDTIVINGSAKVHATGGDSDTYGGAGIGAGGNGACGSITIGGSADVTATGGYGSSYSGAGIGAGGGNGGVDIVEDEVVITPTCNKINITGGTVDATGGTGADGIGGNARSTVESVSISGGTFTANTFPNGAIPADYLADGYELKQDADGTWSVEKEEETPPAPTGVAQIGDKTYETLQGAVDEVPTDGTPTTVTLIDDITGMTTNQIVTIAANQNIELDMGGHHITVDAGFEGRPIKNYGTLTVTGDGVIDSSASNLGGYGAIDNYGTLTIKNGTYTGSVNASGASIRNRPDCTLIIENGTFNGAVTAVYNEGTTKIYGGLFDCHSCSACNRSSWGYTIQSHKNVNGKSPELYFYNGTVIGVQGAFSSSAGYTEIHDGKFETVPCEKHPNGASTFYALYVAGEDEDVKCVVYDGTFKSAYRTAVLIGNDNTNGDGGINANATSEIKGGIFIAPDGVQAITGATNTGNPVITGGTFSSRPDEKYFAEGFVPQENADGTWGVAKKNEAEINGEQYATLSEALNKVRDGETIKVLAPATVDTAETYEITGKTITLNLNGQTVAWNTSAKEAITVKDGGLTIQDSGTSGALNFTSTYNSTSNSGIYVYTGGSLTINSGTVTYCHDSKSGRAIYTLGSGALAMTGGTVKISGATNYALYLNGTASSEITGGRIVFDDQTSASMVYGLCAYGSGAVNITDLEVDGSNVPETKTVYCVYGANNHISGGTYKTNSRNTSYAVSGPSSNTSSISSGTFNGAVKAGIGKITGGLFSVQPSVNYLSEGKIYEKREDGYYHVVNGTYVACMDGVGYTSWDDLFSNVPDNSSSAKIVDVMSASNMITIPAKKNVTFRSTADYKIGKIVNNGSLRVISQMTDTVIENNGTLSLAHEVGSIVNAENASVTIAYSTSSNAKVTDSIVNSGTLNIASGTYPCDIQNSGTLNITGGTFQGSVTSAGTSNITGGTFSADIIDLCANGYTTRKNREGTWEVVIDDRVAQNGEYWYSSLADALKDVRTGETVTLLKDASLKNQITITDKNITIDTNGHIVTYTGENSYRYAVINLSGTSNVLVTGNGTFTFDSNYVTYNDIGYIFSLAGNSSLTIENGTYHAGITCIQLDESAVAYIKDGIFSTDSVLGLYDGKYWALNRIDNSDTKFYVYGGTFENYDPSNSATEDPANNFCADGYMTTSEVKDGKTYYTVVPAAAEINDTYYTTLADAIAAAEDNATITLLADVTEDVVVPAGKTITLDLNGYKITNAADHTIVNNGTLTITDSSEAKTGTVDNIAHGYAAIYNNGTMTIEAGTYTRSLETQDYVDDGADNSWYTVVNDGTMTINGGTFTTADGQPENLGNRSSLVRNGDDATSNTGVTLTITGGQFISGANVIKNEQGSVIASISGGTFTMDNSQIAWYGGNNVIQTYGTITSITGGTFKALGDGTPIDQDNRYYRHGIGVYGEGKIENIGGTVSFEMKGSQNRLIRCDDTGSINITGGTYELADREGNNNVLIYKGDETAKIAISGGTFSDEPDDAYLVDGYAPEQNTDGDWVVVEKAFVAEIDGGQKYDSLIDAVNVAKVSGQTVKLLADVENLQAVEGEDYALLIDANQSMTLDLNGHKITATLNNTEEFNLIKNYGELTITDNSEGQNGSIEVTENGSAEKARTSILYNGYDTGKFTLEAGTLKLTGGEGSKKPLYGVYSSGTTVVMNGGAIEVRRLNSYYEYSESWDVYGIYNSSGCQTTVNGGTITVENQGMYNSAYGIFNASGTVSIHGTPETPYIAANAFNTGIYFEHTLYGNITLYGGKYNMQTDTATGWIEGENNITIAEGYEKKFNGNRTVSIVKSPVAQIGSTKYDTLEEALKEAKSGDTIKLLQNVALTDRVIISKNITLNLNDKTISSTADYAFIVNTGSSFTLENGTLSASQNGVFGLTSSTVTLASDAAINAGAAGITATNNLLEQGNATINVYGTIDSEDVAVWGQGPNNTINVDGATITSKYFGVYQNGSFGGTTITIKNSTITDESENGTGIYVSNNGTNAANPDQGFQNLIIENSTITGNTAVEVKFTNVTISGDDTCLTATGTPVDSGMNNNGSVTTGYAFAVTHNGTESSKDAAEGTVTISGGKFTGAVGIQEPSEGETTSATISISGGSFSVKPDDSYLAPYYEASQNTTGDNYWTVDVAANIEAIWITDTATEPGMLSDLLGKATSGTVQLLKDVEAGNVTSTYPVTLDLNGNTLETTALALFDGAVVDSTEGKGLLKVGVTRNTPNITLKENNPSLFIYDSEAAGYRLYSYTFEKLRAYTTDQSGKSMGFYFRLTFENLAAWGKLNTAETTHGVIMSTVLELPNKTIMTVYFDQSTIQGVAGSIVGGAAQTGKGFWLTVTGLNKLEAGQTLKVTPTLEAAGDKLVINTEAFEYSKSADESN